MIGVVPPGKCERSSCQKPGPGASKESIVSVPTADTVGEMV